MTQLTQQPADLQIEKALLGTMLLDANQIEDIKTRLKTKAVFFFEPHQIIVETIWAMFDKGAQIDIVTLTAQLRDSKKLEYVGGAYEIGSLLDHATGMNVDTYCMMLLELYAKRELYKVCGKTITDIYKPDVDVFDLLASTEKQLGQIVENNITVPFAPIGHGLNEDIEQLYERIENVKQNNFALSGVDTGYRTLNLITNGWQKGELIILAARPSVGKTAFALNLALKAIESQSTPSRVGFFSLEMDTSKLRMRVMANVADVGMTNLTTGRLNNAEVQRIETNRNKVATMPLFIDENSNASIIDIKAKIRQMVNKFGVRLVIIDYLQLISPTDRKMIREQQIAEISRELKKVTKELKIPIIALSQLSREIEKRADKEPNLADLRESGAIEQDADVVAFLYRHDDLIKLKFAKNRNGKLDIIDLKANYDTQKFYEANEAPENPYIGFKATETSGTAPVIKNPFTEDSPF